MKIGCHRIVLPFLTETPSFFHEITGGGFPSVEHEVEALVELLRLPFVVIIGRSKSRKTEKIDNLY